MEKLARKLMVYRKREALTQETMSRLLNITYVTYSRWERGYGMSPLGKDKAAQFLDETKKELE